MFPAPPAKSPDKNKKTIIHKITNILSDFILGIFFMILAPLLISFSIFGIWRIFTPIIGGTINNQFYITFLITFSLVPLGYIIFNQTQKKSHEISLLPTKFYSIMKILGLMFGFEFIYLVFIEIMNYFIIPDTSIKKMAFFPLIIYNFYHFLNFKQIFSEDPYNFNKSFLKAIIISILFRNILFAAYLYFQFKILNLFPPLLSTFLILTLVVLLNKKRRSSSIKNNIYVLTSVCVINFIQGSIIFSFKLIESTTTLLIQIFIILLFSYKIFICYLSYFTLKNQILISPLISFTKKYFLNEITSILFFGLSILFFSKYFSIIFIVIPVIIFMGFSLFEQKYSIVHEFFGILTIFLNYGTIAGVISFIIIPFSLNLQLIIFTLLWIIFSIFIKQNKIITPKFIIIFQNILYTALFFESSFYFTIITQDLIFNITDSLVYNYIFFITFGSLLSFYRLYFLHLRNKQELWIGMIIFFHYLILIIGFSMNIIEPLMQFSNRFILYLSNLQNDKFFFYPISGLQNIKLLFFLYTAKTEIISIILDIIISSSLYSILLMINKKIKLIDSNMWRYLKGIFRILVSILVSFLIFFFLPSFFGISFSMAIFLFSLSESFYNFMNIKKSKELSDSKTNTIIFLLDLFFFLVAFSSLNYEYFNLGLIFSSNIALIIVLIYINFIPKIKKTLDVIFSDKYLLNLINSFLIGILGIFTLLSIVSLSDILFEYNLFLHIYPILLIFSIILANFEYWIIKLLYSGNYLSHTKGGIFQFFVSGQVIISNYLLLMHFIQTFEVLASSIIFFIGSISLIGIYIISKIKAKKYDNDYGSLLKKFWISFATLAWILGNIGFLISFWKWISLNLFYVSFGLLILLSLFLVIIPDLQTIFSRNQSYLDKIRQILIYLILALIILTVFSLISIQLSQSIFLGIIAGLFSALIILNYVPLIKNPISSIRRNDINAIFLEFIAIFISFFLFTLISFVDSSFSSYLQKISLLLFPPLGFSFISISFLKKERFTERLYLIFLQVAIFLTIINSSCFIYTHLIKIFSISFSLLLIVVSIAILLLIDYQWLKILMHHRIGLFSIFLESIFLTITLNLFILNMLNFPGIIQFSSILLAVLANLILNSKFLLKIYKKIWIEKHSQFTILKSHQKLFHFLTNTNIIGKLSVIIIFFTFLSPFYIIITKSGIFLFFLLLSLTIPVLWMIFQLKPIFSKKTPFRKIQEFFFFSSALYILWLIFSLKKNLYTIKLFSNLLDIDIIYLISISIIDAITMYYSSHLETESQWENHIFSVLLLTHSFVLFFIGNLTIPAIIFYTITLFSCTSKIAWNNVLYQFSIPISGILYFYSIINNNISISRFNLILFLITWFFSSLWLILQINIQKLLFLKYLKSILGFLTVINSLITYFSLYIEYNLLFTKISPWFALFMSVIMIGLKNSPRLQHRKTIYDIFLTFFLLFFFYSISFDFIFNNSLNPKIISFSLGLNITSLFTLKLLNYSGKFKKLFQITNCVIGSGATFFFVYFFVNSYYSNFINSLSWVKAISLLINPILFYLLACFLIIFWNDWKSFWKFGKIFLTLFYIFNISFLVSAHKKIDIIWVLTIYLSFLGIYFILIGLPPDFSIFPKLNRRIIQILGFYIIISAFIMFEYSLLSQLFSNRWLILALSFFGSSGAIFSGKLLSINIIYMKKISAILGLISCAVLGIFILQLNLFSLMGKISFFLFIFLNLIQIYQEIKFIANYGHKIFQFGSAVFLGLIFHEIFVQYFQFFTEWFNLCITILIITSYLQFYKFYRLNKKYTYLLGILAFSLGLMEFTSFFQFFTIFENLLLFFNIYLINIAIYNSITKKNSKLHIFSTTQSNIYFYLILSSLISFSLNIFLFLILTDINIKKSMILMWIVLIFLLIHIFNIKIIQKYDLFQQIQKLPIFLDIIRTILIIFIYLDIAGILTEGIISFTFFQFSSQPLIFLFFNRLSIFSIFLFPMISVIDKKYVRLANDHIRHSLSWILFTIINLSCCFQMYILNVDWKILILTFSSLNFVIFKLYKISNPYSRLTLLLQINIVLVLVSLGLIITELLEIWNLIQMGVFYLLFLNLSILIGIYFIFLKITKFKPKIHLFVYNILSILISLTLADLLRIKVNDSLIFIISFFISLTIILNIFNIKKIYYAYLFWASLSYTLTIFIIEIINLLFKYNFSLRFSINIILFSFGLLTTLFYRFIALNGYKEFQNKKYLGIFPEAEKISKEIYSVWLFLEILILAFNFSELWNYFFSEFVLKTIKISSIQNSLLYLSITALIISIGLNFIIFFINKYKLWSEYPNLNKNLRFIRNGSGFATYFLIPWIFSFNLHFFIKNLAGTFPVYIIDILFFSGLSYILINTVDPKYFDLIQQKVRSRVLIILLIIFGFNLGLLWYKNSGKIISSLIIFSIFSYSLKLHSDILGNLYPKIIFLLNLSLYIEILIQFGILLFRFIPIFPSLVILSLVLHLEFEGEDYFTFLKPYIIWINKAKIISWLLFIGNTSIFLVIYPNYSHIFYSIMFLLSFLALTSYYTLSLIFKQKLSLKIKSEKLIGKIIYFLSIIWIIWGLYNLNSLLNTFLSPLFSIFIVTGMFSTSCYIILVFDTYKLQFFSRATYLKVQPYIYYLTFTLYAIISGLSIFEIAYPVGYTLEDFTLTSLLIALLIFTSFEFIVVHIKSKKKIFDHIFYWCLAIEINLVIYIFEISSLLVITSIFTIFLYPFLFFLEIIQRFLENFYLQIQKFIQSIRKFIKTIIKDLWMYLKKIYLQYQIVIVLLFAFISGIGLFLLLNNYNINFISKISSAFLTFLIAIYPISPEKSRKADIINFRNKLFYRTSIFLSIIFGAYGFVQILFWFVPLGILALIGFLIFIIKSVEEKYQLSIVWRLILTIFALIDLVWLAYLIIGRIWQ